MTSIEIPSEDTINVVVDQGRTVKASFPAPVEVIKVHIDAIGQKGDSGGGSGGGDGTDQVARLKAAQAFTLATQAQSDLNAHTTASQPHKAYDEDIPSLALIFQNGLI
jgi:hypothetical protein